MKKSWLAVVAFVLPVLVLWGSERQAVIRSPVHGQQIGEAGDPLCPPGDKPCFKIRADGVVPDQLTPFFAVEPLDGSQIWIQPRATINSDGSVSSLIHLGECDNGAGQDFRIYLFGCPNPKRFRTGQKIDEPPADCEVSTPVVVTRVR